MQRIKALKIRNIYYSNITQAKGARGLSEWSGRSWVVLRFWQVNNAEKSMLVKIAYFQQNGHIKI